VARQRNRPAREVRRTAWALPGPVVWLCRAQAVGLLVGALVLIVLTASSQMSTSGAFLAADVLFAVLLAALLTLAATRSWARTPIFLTELLAVLVSTEVWTSGRHLIALLVGVPALVAVVLVVVTAKPPPRT
jgi:hypothetical protein